MTKGALTLITSTKPSNLGKCYRLTAQDLVKSTAGQMASGDFEVISFETASDLANLLQGVGTNQAVTASLPRNSATAGTIVTAAEKRNHPGALSRTKADFGFAGQPGVLVLDFDPPADGAVLIRNQLWHLVQSVLVGAGVAGVVWWCSGSSFIFNGETELQGIRGQRLYLMVADASDTERVGEVMFKRLALAGHLRVEVSKSGAMLLRSIFDQAMFQPARLDFIGGAVCEAPLVQRRGDPVVLADGDFLDTRKALPDLTAAEEATYEDMVAAAKKAAQPEAERIKAAWAAERQGVMVQKLMLDGVPPVEATERAQRSLESAQRGVLMGDFEITLDSGEVVSVGKVLDDRARFHGVLTRDPLEPGYQGGKTCGKLLLYGGAPVLTSRAHGGQTFRLCRQPTRLYLVKGGKAGLVDEIASRLAAEGDVFAVGGVPSLVVNGETKPLSRAALMHLVQSRMAFYSFNARGQDVACDLPGDVVDMLLGVI